MRHAIPLVPVGLARGGTVTCCDLPSVPRVGEHVTLDLDLFVVEWVEWLVTATPPTAQVTCHLKAIDSTAFWIDKLSPRTGGGS